MIRKQNFFGRLVASADLVVLFASFLAAFSVRLKLWQLGYPLLPAGSARSAAWIVTIMFPAWVVALRYFNLYSPIRYRSTRGILTSLIKSQVLASILMVNSVFIIRGFDGISRPLLALIIGFSFVGLVIEKLALLILFKFRWRLHRRSAHWRVLLVGTRADAESYLELVRQHPEWNLEVVDIVSPSAGQIGVGR
jgi:FlaA1/EpsC-like NDP-sugar epimerase